MEQLKKIGQLARQHYEKMILIIVLLLFGGKKIPEPKMENLQGRVHSLQTTGCDGA